MYNGMDANGFENNGKHSLSEESFTASPFLPPPPPTSAQVSPSGDGSWNSDSLTASPQSTWPSVGGAYSINEPLPGETSGTGSQSQTPEVSESKGDEPSEHSYEPVAKKLKMDDTAECSQNSPMKSSDQSSNNSSGSCIMEEAAEIAREAAENIKPSGEISKFENDFEINH